MFVERKDYNKVITVKLVFPVGCNAKCNFCYNKERKINNCNSIEFLNNFIESFDALYKAINGKNEISLDMTGGEPTLNESLFKEVMFRLKEYGIKDKVCRVTLTTNGTNVVSLAPYMKGVIDYVNISVHEWNAARRENILGIKMKDSYKDMVTALNKSNIPVSASAVIFEEIPDFNTWRDNFINFAKECGFIGVRFRCDVFWNNAEVFDKYLLDAVNDNKFQVLIHEQTTDSHWCRLRMEDKFRVFFLHGVIDTSILTKGIEYIIDTNGKCYCDYDRRVAIEDYPFEIGKIYDYVKD